ncbi:MAG: NAD kinase [Spirosomataceae bacterium]
MKIAIHGRQFNEQAKPFIQAMFDELARRHVEVQLSASYFEMLRDGGVKHPYNGTYTNCQELNATDFIFSLGGDGTLLDTVTQVGPKEIPILGVNIGRLGFLATVAPSELVETLAILFEGDYVIDERSLVHLEAERDLFDGLNFGLNECTITKTDTSSMIVVHTHINGEFLNSYWADGLLVSTPTGSTGYCLSVGGPVMLPHSQSFVVAPISPHNLNVRPMIVEDTSVITMEVESRSRSFLVSLDSRSRIVEGSLPITIRKENFKARLVKMPDDRFLNTLRNKLNWGLDIRNW